MAQTQAVMAPRQEALWVRRKCEQELLAALLLDRKMVCGCGSPACDNNPEDLDARIRRARHNIGILTDRIIDG
jgi:hypothetical protein